MGPVEGLPEDQLGDVGFDLQRNARNLNENSVEVRTPITKIPIEIISEIFDISLSPEEPFEQHQRVAFMHLRCVCRLWRKILFNTPAYWRGLTIPLGKTVEGEYVDPDLPTSVEVISQWFDRAGPHASVTLSFLPFSDPEAISTATAEFATRVMTVVATEKRRWDLIELPSLFIFSADIPLKERVVLKMLRAISLPQAETPWAYLDKVSLPINPVDPGEWPFQLNGPRSFEAALPKLKNLGLSWRCPWSLPISHSSIESLDLALLNPVSTSVGLSILAQFPAIKDLALCASNIHAMSEETAPLQPIRLDSLQGLNLTVSQQALEYAGRLELPQLRFLLLVGGAPGTSLDLLSLTSTIRQTRVKALMITSPLRGRHVVALLSASAKMEILTVRSLRFLKYALDSDGIGTCLMPELKVLYVMKRLNATDLDNLVQYFGRRISALGTGEVEPMESGQGLSVESGGRVPKKHGVTIIAIQDLSEDAFVEEKARLRDYGVVLRC
ncbi:hypothetical protein FA15DRAFT_666958 [Coprinopsis marcescibilis]|uniref:Uncharacterized protein n=1 Tax=Coprinopsis marcescibilis TaxID=230819 RepID=A0A5C3L2Q3_COPMA|nr:hypothetical protein FA15DRAFT_666958 [Coprinopsis marcescibilis]